MYLYTKIRRNGNLTFRGSEEKHSLSVRPSRKTFCNVAVEIKAAVEGISRSNYTSTNNVLIGS